MATIASGDKLVVTSNHTISVTTEIEYVGSYSMKVGRISKYDSRGYFNEDIPYLANFVSKSSYYGGSSLTPNTIGNYRIDAVYRPHDEGGRGWKLVIMINLARVDNTSGYKLVFNPTNMPTTLYMKINDKTITLTRQTSGEFAGAYVWDGYADFLSNYNVTINFDLWAK